MFNRLEDCFILSSTPNYLLFVTDNDAKLFLQTIGLLLVDVLIPVPRREKFL